MKRDIFRRGPRFTHQFGTLEEINGPFFGPGTWDPPWPKRVDQLSATGYPCEIQQHGEHFYAPERSGVTKPAGGQASLNGPSPDLAELVGRPMPASTKRRLGPLKTDK